MPAVRHSRSRDIQQGPVDRTSDALRRVGFFGLVSEVVFVGWFEIDEGPMREVRPVLSGWAVQHPLQRFVVVTVSALVADDVKPLFVLKLLPNPLHSAGMKGDRGVRDSSEDGPSDSFPPLRLFSAIIAIPAQN